MSFRFEAILGLRIGSSSPLFGRHIRWSAIRLQVFALSTIFFVFESESSTVVALLSMYPSHPPFVWDGGWAATRRAIPNGMLSSSLSVGETLLWRGGGSLCGSQMSQFMRSTAKSNVVTKNWENIAGHGEDPKARRHSMVPISSSGFFFKVPSSFRLCRN